MTVVTWTANVNEWDRAERIILRSGALVLNLGQAADLTAEEIAALQDKRVFVLGGTPLPATPQWLPAVVDENGNFGRQSGSQITDQGNLLSVESARQWAANPDSLIAGVIVRDANGAATSAPVVWPDGDTGVYTATTVSTAFPGAVDAYTITKDALTYTQPAMTRDANGAVTNRPAITVA